MDHIGIDVHKRESQIYILTEGGEVIEQRIRTEGERFAAVLGSRPRAAGLGRPVAGARGGAQRGSADRGLEQRAAARSGRRGEPFVRSRRAPA